jgi:hypothetical protein
MLIVLVFAAAIGITWQTWQPLFGHLFPTGPKATMVLATVSQIVTLPATRQVISPTPDLPAVTPSPEIKKKLSLVWSKEAPKLYLRQAPDGLAVGLLENGTQITPGDKVFAGGQTWVRVNGSGFEGWVASSLIYSLDAENPIMLVTVEDGVYLHNGPEGRITIFLPRGTPVQITETEIVGGITWVGVILPDLRYGWIRIDLLENYEQ